MKSKPKTRFLHRRYLGGRAWGTLWPNVWAAPPAEAWRSIRGFLSQKDRRRCRAVCRGWQAVERAAALGPAVCPLLSLPGDVTAHIAFVLCQLQDRAQLSSCCSALLACSQQHNAAWWGSSLDLSLLSQQGARVAALTAWLARCRPNLSQLRVLMPHNYDHDFAERAGFYVADERLRAAVTLPSPPLSSLVDLQLSCQAVTPQGLRAILLTCLSLRQCDISAEKCHVPPKAAGALSELGRLCLQFNRDLFADALLRLASPLQLIYLDLTA